MLICYSKCSNLRLTETRSRPRFLLLAICIVNHMINVNFSKTNEIAQEPVGRVQFGVFEKFTSAYLFQIAQEKSSGYLLITQMEKFRDG